MLDLILSRVVLCIATKDGNDSIRNLRLHDQQEWPSRVLVNCGYRAPFGRKTLAWVSRLLSISSKVRTKADGGLESIDNVMYLVRFGDSPRRVVFARMPFERHAAKQAYIRIIW